MQEMNWKIQAKIIDTEDNQIGHLNKRMMQNICKLNVQIEQHNSCTWSHEPWYGLLVFDYVPLR